MGADERIGRARQAIGCATDLLRRPVFDRVSEIAVQLEAALAELEGAARAGINPDSASAVVALCADLRLLTALHLNADQFYSGWARIAAAFPGGYTCTGTEMPPPGNPASVSAQG